MRMNTTSRRHLIPLTLILLLGFWLRVHELGRDGLRLDEAGQALAAIQPTVAGMLAIERTHAMAMPLDYLGTRLAAQIGLTELVLRYPSAVWGTLSIALVYLLARRLRLSPAVGLVAAFFLALSPNHIYYAQELRFYASLQAWSLAATIAMIPALRYPTTRSWVLFGLVAAVGAYFHPYVLLTAVFGAVYLLMIALRDRAIDRRAWIGLISTTLILGAVFLPAYLYFGTQQTYEFEALQWTGTWDRFLLGGLDWTNRINTAPTTLATVWAVTNLLLMGAGLWRVLSQRPRNLMVISLVLSLFLSTALIVITTVARGYWLLPRQIIHLSPVLMILAAIGVVWLADLIGRHDSPSPRPMAWQVIVPTLVVLLVLVAGYEKLEAHYTAPRATGREVAQTIMATHSGVEPIWMIPRFEAQSYLFYLLRDGRAELGSQLVPSSLDQLGDQLAGAEGPQYLAVATGLLPEQLAELQQLGFVSVPTQPNERPSRYQLFIRP